MSYKDNAKRAFETSGRGSVGSIASTPIANAVSFVDPVALQRLIDALQHSVDSCAAIVADRRGVRVTHLRPFVEAQAEIEATLQALQASIIEASTDEAKLASWWKRATWIHGLTVDTLTGTYLETETAAAFRAYNALTIAFEEAGIDLAKKKKAAEATKKTIWIVGGAAALAGAAWYLSK